MKVFDVRKKAEYVEAPSLSAVSVPYDEKRTCSRLWCKKRWAWPQQISYWQECAYYCVLQWTKIAGNPIKHQSLLIKAGYKEVCWYRNDGSIGWKSRLSCRVIFNLRGYSMSTYSPCRVDTKRLALASYRQISWRRGIRSDNCIWVMIDILLQDSIILMFSLHWRSCPRWRESFHFW